MCLQHTAPRCTILHHTAPYCTTLRRTETHCTALHHTAKHCNTLQHPATHCTTMHHAAPRCTTPHGAHPQTSRQRHFEHLCVWPPYFVEPPRHQHPIATHLEYVRCGNIYTRLSRQEPPVYCWSVLQRVAVLLQCVAYRTLATKPTSVLLRCDAACCNVVAVCSIQDS